MNHISETPNPESSSSSSSVSWKSRMVAKIKECREAIKNMMSFDVPLVYRTPIKTNNSCDSKACSDVVAFSSLALKHDEPILTGDSSDKKTWNRAWNSLEFEEIGSEK